jgi:hypothetical protein
LARLTKSMASASALLFCAALLAGTGPVRPPDGRSSPAALREPSSTADDVVPIDFATAICVARSSLQSGASPERAVADADLVLSGERPFASLSSLPVAGGYLCDGWLTGSERRVALHEVCPHERKLRKWTRPHHPKHKPTPPRSH